MALGEERAGDREERVPTRPGDKELRGGGVLEEDEEREAERRGLVTPPARPPPRPGGGGGRGVEEAECSREVSCYSRGVLG